MQASFGLKNGKIIARQYRVLSLLGHGWEGEVYKVEELSTGIIRVIKLFYHHPDSPDPHIQYAKKLNRLRNCPIVIRYHHQGSTIINKKRIDFLVSDFIEGELLSTYIQRKPRQRLSEFEALHLFYALVQGVELIHFHGEYHGDIHPENILIRRKGLGFEVHFIDLLHLGRMTKQRIQSDVYDLINVMYEMIGGARYYRKMPDKIKQIILGRKQLLIAKRFNHAGDLRLYLENLEWE